MIRKYVLPILALGLLAFAILHVVRAQQSPPPVKPPIEPARTPYSQTVAGAGLIEARTENIAVGSPLAGIVVAVKAKVGDPAKKGDELFRLDDRQLRADKGARQASLAHARAQVERLRNLPRPEEVPLKEARVKETRANLLDQQDQLKRAEALYARRAIGEEELVRRQQAYNVARQQVAWAEADYELLKAGAWDADIEIAQAAADLAEAQLKQVETDLERLVVRALVDGEVLQVNVRPGEYVNASSGQALVLVGNTDRLHVRVDIDEHDIPRFRPGAKAQATLRGHPNLVFPLEFVRVEPFVVPKKSLTGDNTERVDTRVLQVIYALESGEKSVYVGQQVDVSINASPPSVASR